VLEFFQKPEGAELYCAKLSPTQKVDKDGNRRCGEAKENERIEKRHEMLAKQQSRKNGRKAT
jgi:hypothetical protein